MSEALRLPTVVPRGATGWRLPLLVLACGLLVGALLIFFAGFSPRPASLPDTMPAKVVDTTPCGPQDARDTIQVIMDGRSERLVLDGCGTLTANGGQDAGGVTLHVEHPGAYPLIEHERHTAGVLQLEVGEAGGGAPAAAPALAGCTAAVPIRAGASRVLAAGIGVFGRPPSR